MEDQKEQKRTEGLLVARKVQQIPLRDYLLELG